MRQVLRRRAVTCRPYLFLWVNFTRDELWDSLLWENLSWDNLSNHSRTISGGFAVFCFAMLWHVFFFFPEIANKTLEEVNAIFDDTKPIAIRFIGTPAWKTHNVRHETILKETNQLGH